MLVRTLERPIAAEGASHKNMVLSEYLWEGALAAMPAWRAGSVSTKGTKDREGPGKQPGQEQNIKRKEERKLRRFSEFRQARSVGCPQEPADFRSRNTASAEH